MEISRSSQSNREDLYKDQNFSIVVTKVEIRKGWWSVRNQRGLQEKIIVEYGIDIIMKRWLYEDGRVIYKFSLYMTTDWLNAKFVSRYSYKWKD